MVHVAMHAVRHDPHWKQVYQRLSPRLGRNKTLVAIARKLLIAIWHILTKGQADRFASEWRVAAGLHALAYKIGVANLAEDRASQFVRNQLDRLGIGQELTHIPWGSKNVKLPPSALPPEPGED